MFYFKNALYTTFFYHCCDKKLYKKNIKNMKKYKNNAIYFIVITMF